MANNDRRTFNVARNKPASVTQEQPALDDALIDDGVAPELVAQSAPQEEPVATAPLVEIAPVSGWVESSCPFRYRRIAVPS